MPSSPLLSRFVEDELARAVPLMEDVVQAVLSARSGASVSNRSPQDKVLEHELMLSLAKNRPMVVKRFVDELRERAFAEMNKGSSSTGSGSSRAPPAKLTLSLVDEVEVTSDVELSRVIEAISSVAEYELRELRAFTSALLGEESVSRETNPLHAETYAHALLAAGRALPLSRGHNLIFMRQAAGPLAQGIRNAAAAACTRLEAQGIEPSVYRTIVQPKSVVRRTVNQPGPVSQAAYIAVPDEPAPAPLAEPMPMIAVPPITPPAPNRGFPPPQAPAMPPMIQIPPPMIQVPPAAPPAGRIISSIEHPTRSNVNARPAPPATMPMLHISLNELRESMPVPLDPPKNPVSPLDEALLKAEERLRLLPDGAGGLPGQIPTLGEQREQLLHSASSRVDQQLIELLARLFDAILANRRIPAQFQVLISRLHASALRVALREPDMLDAYSHPVWVFMDRLAFQSTLHGPDGDPELAEAMQLGQTLIDQISKESLHDGSLYRRALERVMTYERNRFERRRKALAGQIDALRHLTGAEAPPGQQPMLDVQTMDTVPGDLLGGGMVNVDESARSMHELQTGQWLNVFLQGKWRIAQLVWRGEGAWLLAGVEHRPETWAVRVAALQILHAENLLKPLEPVSLVQKAAERVLNEMASSEVDVPVLVQDTRT